MDLLRRRCVSRNHKDLILLIESLMCVDSSKCCMVSNKHIVFGTPRSIAIGLGFTKSEVDENLYHILVEGKLLIIVLYVDDFILISDEKMIKSCKDDLVREFELMDMGLMHYFLGLEVWQGDGELFVSQRKCANEILKILCMESCKPMDTPLMTNLRKDDATLGEEVDFTIYRQLVGSPMYLVNTWLDVCYAFNHLS